MRTRPLVLAPCGLVQVIRLTWDKAARGGQGARDRNAVPRAFEVPSDRMLAVGGQLHVEESHWSDRNSFAEPFASKHKRISVGEEYRFGCVTVSQHPDGLLVRYQYDRAHGGAPDRWFFNAARGYGESPGRSFVVHLGQWVRVCYNGRFSCWDSGRWGYQHVTVNVAWFGGEPSGQVFVTSQPVQELKALADLW